MRNRIIDYRRDGKSVDAYADGVSTHHVGDFTTDNDAEMAVTALNQLAERLNFLENAVVVER